MHSDQVKERLRAADEAILRHPAYARYLEYDALGSTIYAVFLANWEELLHLLDIAATNAKLAMELVQNVRSPDVRRQFHALTIRRLHNYCAGTMTLVDHVRRIMSNRTDPLATEFNNRKQELINHAEVPFFQDLRNFMLHRQLPFLGHRLSITNANTPEAKMESEVQLSVRQLLEWDKWSPASKHFLNSHGEAVVLRPFVRTHGVLVRDLNVWLYGELCKANEAGLNEVNELAVARNAILTDGDLEKARRATEWANE